jgi:hypothetical protein
MYELSREGISALNILQNGSQGQTERAVALQQEEEHFTEL